MEDVKGLISIIVPIYSVENYIDRCLESIVSQTYKNLEIILVDDESPDNCPYICDQWAQKDERIHVIHKKNQGLGMARNSGMEIAHGEYICFCDSDDYISREMIEICYRKAKEYSTDMVCYGFYCEDKSLKIKETIKATTVSFYSDRQQVRDQFIPGMVGFNPDTGETIGLWMSLCGCLVSSELIRRANWKCESERNIISEDMYSLLELYSYLDNALVLDDVFYHYCENEASLSRSYIEDRFEKIKVFYLSTLELCDKLGYSNLIKREVAQPFLNYIIADMKQIVGSDKIEAEKQQLLNKIMGDKLLKKVLVECKNEKWEIKKQVLFYFIRARFYLPCYCLLYLKNK